MRVISSAFSAGEGVAGVRAQAWAVQLAPSCGCSYSTGLIDKVCMDVSNKNGIDRHYRISQQVAPDRDKETVTAALRFGQASCPARPLSCKRQGARRSGQLINRCPGWSNTLR